MVFLTKDNDAVQLLTPIPISRSEVYALLDKQTNQWYDDDRHPPTLGSLRDMAHAVIWTLPLGESALVNASPCPAAAPRSVHSSFHVELLRDRGPVFHILHVAQGYIVVQLDYNHARSILLTHPDAQ